MSPLKPVNSTMIEAAGYDLASRTLAVHFKAGTAVHHFKDVPPEIFDGLNRAESIGRYFNANVRGKFEHTLQPINPENPAT